MFCGECGAKLSDDLEKCPVCGTYVSEHYVPQATDVAEDSQPGVQVEEATEYNVSVERQSEPEITVYSGNESFSDQYAVEEKEQKAFPEKNDKNGKWMYATGVCLILAMVGVIGFSIWNDNYNVSDVADGAEQYEEPYEEQPWIRATLYMTTEEINEKMNNYVFPFYSGSMVVIGDYIYLAHPSKSSILVYDRELNKETEIQTGPVEQLNTDGRRLYYVKNNQIYRADPDGSYSKSIIDPGDREVLAYTVDGNMIYYSEWGFDRVLVKKYNMDNEMGKELCDYDTNTVGGIVRWNRIPYLEISISEGDPCINLKTMKEEDLEGLYCGLYDQIYASDFGELILEDPDGNELCNFGSVEELNICAFGRCEDYFYLMTEELQENQSTKFITYLYRYSTGEMNRIEL